MNKLLILLGTLLLMSIPPAISDEIVRDHSVMIPMRDGIELATDFYQNPDILGKKPTILIRTVYNKNNAFDESPIWAELAKQGYVIAIQDIRGRFESGGEYKVAEGRREDGIDTLDWIIQQPWSDQQVATGGCSYLGETQVILAATNHPNLVTAAAMSPASGYYVPGRAWQAFSGGAFELGQTAGWFAGSGSSVYTQPPEGVDRGSYWREMSGKVQMTPHIDFKNYLNTLKQLPTIDVHDRADLPPSDYQLWRTSDPDGDYYRTRDFVTEKDSVSIPILFMDSWYDYGAQETLQMMQQFAATGRTDAARNHQNIVIGPGTHCNYPYAKEKTIVGNRDVGDARYPYHQMQIDWYNYWLKGERNNVTQRPPIQYYQMGVNEWRTANTWPPVGTKYQRWYLNGTKANSLSGNGTLSTKNSPESFTQEFIYDPDNPVPSLGGHTCCTGTDTEAGGYDQSAIEQRDDILVFTSPVLSEDLTMAGPIRANLHVSSDALDTDFTVKLVDVYPDGKAYNIQEGVLRMRYRDSLRKATLMQKDRTYQIEVDLHSTANTFLKGHQIRLEISSSNYPRIERNLNTGGNNYDEIEGVKALNRILHGGSYESFILLPIQAN